jgi:hypothetical protein
MPALKVMIGVIDMFIGCAMLSRKFSQCGQAQILRQWNEEDGKLFWARRQTWGFDV